MKILMISIDKGLLGKGQMGDVVERHVKYGTHVDQLDIIVFSGLGFAEYSLSDKVTSYPTNSKGKLNYYFDALKIGKKLFVKNKYDLVITQEPFVTGLVGKKLKKKFGAKLLVHFHGDFWRNKNWLKESKINFLFLLMSKGVIKQADGIRVMSQGQKEKLAKYKNKIIEIISTPVDIKKYARASVSVDDTVLHVSRFDKVKDFETLNKAFEVIKDKLPNTKFVQVGGGKEAENFFKLDVDVKPITSQDELINYFNNSSVVVLSSTSESFGKVLVEANACGKPVVATATTGAKEIISDGVNGFLVSIGDAQKLAEKTIELLENPKEAKQMGEAGKKLVSEKYGDNTQKIINLWTKIINS